jgi:hypothetical protein
MIYYIYYVMKTSLSTVSFQTTMLKKLLHRYKYNKKQIQAIDSTSCGFYCVAFIEFMHGKRAVEKAFNCFLNLFGENTLDNEIVLHGILYG